MWSPERLNAGLRQIATASGVPYIGVALTIAGLRHDSGVAADDSLDSSYVVRHGRFKIGCAMKILLAILALELASRRTIDLDASLNRYLPELAATPKGRDITLAHLLTHTAGYRNFDARYEREANDSPDWNEFVRMLTEAEQVFKPGTVFNYQHSESILMQAILERAAGHAFADILREVVFTPLGLEPGPQAAGEGVEMSGHTYDTSEGRFVPVGTSPQKSNGTFWEAAVSHTTLSLIDWVVIAEALISAHHGKASPFSMRTSTLLANRFVNIPELRGGRLSNALPKAYGMGSPLFHHGAIGHDTFVDGQTLGLRIDLERRVAFAVGMTADRPFLRLMATSHVMRTLYGPEPPSSSVLRPGIPTEELPGIYDCGSSGDALVKMNGRQLKLTLRNSNSVEHSTMLAIAADGSLHVAAGASCPSIAFFRDPSSQAICLMVGTRAFVKT
jgi:CubicO group peptidase (beta-lactamase class C family)